MRTNRRLIIGAVELAVGVLFLLDLVFWRIYLVAASAICFYAVGYFLYRREAVLNRRFSEHIRRGMTLADVKEIESKYAALPDFDTSEKRAAARPPLERHFYFARYERVRRLLQAHIGDARNILDMGCGFGHITCYIGGHLNRNVVGLDLAYLKLVSARSEAIRQHVAPKTLFVCGDVVQPPFPIASFDCIVLSEVLEHLLDPASGLRACSDLLRQQGTIIITTPSRHNLNYTNNPFIILEKTLSLISDTILAPYHNLHARYEYNWRNPEPEYGMHYNFSRQHLRRLLLDAGFKTVWRGSFEIEVFPFLLIELLASDNAEFMKRYIPPLESLISRLPVSKHLGQHILWVARKEISSVR